MEKRTICGETVSLLGFGCMRLPELDSKIDYGTAQKMVDTAYESGINYYDTAYVYHNGESEVFIGQALKKYPRESYFIADKFPTWMPKKTEDIEGIFNEQLERLGVDYIDFYLIHSLERSCLPGFERLKLYDFFAEKKRQGKIKYLGFSFHDGPDVLQGIVDGYEWDFAQIQLNYLDWSFLQAEKMYNILAEKNIPVIVMEPIRGGFLATLPERAKEEVSNLTPSITPAALALKWVAQHSDIKVILSGMSTPEQVAENIQTFADYKTITEEENAVAVKIVEIISEIKTIPCTGCRYCMDCPSGVGIPDVFALYNRYKVFDDTFRAGFEYRLHFESKRADNCTGCGVCAEHCPQHIDIPAQLKAAHDVLNNL